MCKNLTLKKIHSLGYWIIPSLLLLAAKPLHAQIVQPDRVEIELGDFSDYYTVISAKQQGLVLVRESDEKIDPRSNTWEVLKYNTDLTLAWRRNLQIKIGYEFRGYEYRNGKVYLLFKSDNYQNDEMLLRVLTLGTGDMEESEIKYLFPLNLTEFTVAGNAVILGGYVNYMPAVIHYDLSSKKVKVLPGIYNNRSELIDVSVDEKTNIFNILVTEKTFDKRNTLAIKTFDRNGTLLQNRTLETKGSNNIIFGKSTRFNAREQFIAGTYSGSKSNYSSGIFIAKIDPVGNQDITYISYGDLRNFFSYMKAKREARVRDRINRRKIKGKKVRFRYRLLVHDIVEKDDMFLLFGEAFYPKYNNTSLSSLAYGPYFSRGRNNDNMYFAGYKYTHAVVVAFNKKGKVLWDNSFEINDVTSFSLDQYVNASIEEKRVILLYLYENVIRSKLINQDEILEGKTFNDIKMTFEDDVAKNNDYEVGGLALWYDKFFYAYGVQRIKNAKDREAKLNRKVFYINKITYQ